MLLMLSLLIVTCVFRKRSTRRRKERDRGALGTTDSVGCLEGQRKLHMNEIDDNSLCGIREVPDSGKAELQDETPWKPELSDNFRAELRDVRSSKSVVVQIQELPSPDHPLIRELMAVESITRPTSARLSPPRASIPRSKFALTLSAKYRRGNKLRRGEIGISHLSSRVTSAASFRGLTPDLDRSLPPTPISESPQESRVVSATERQLIEDILLSYYRSRRTSYRSARSSGRRSGETSRHWQRSFY